MTREESTLLSTPSHPISLLGETSVINVLCVFADSFYAYTDAHTRSHTRDTIDTTCNIIVCHAFIAAIDQMFVFPVHSCVENIRPKVLVLGGGTLGR